MESWKYMSFPLFLYKNQLKTSGTSKLTSQRKK
jgi:hypothetical protein